MKQTPFLFCLIALLGACAPQMGLTLESSNAISHEVTQDEVYCGADQGAILTEGDYVIRSPFDEFSVDHLTLVSGKPHDGLRIFSTNEMRFYQLNQYESCNSESVRMFRSDNDGNIYEVLFEKNGDILKEVSTDYLGTVREKNGLFSFCPYDNISGNEICDSYRFDEGNFVYVSTY